MGEGSIGLGKARSMSDIALQCLNLSRVSMSYIVIIVI